MESKASLGLPNWEQKKAVHKKLGDYEDLGFPGFFLLSKTHLKVSHNTVDGSLV